MSHDSFKCVTWLRHTLVLTQIYPPIRALSCICVALRIHTCDMACSYVCHDLCKHSCTPRYTHQRVHAYACMHIHIHTCTHVCIHAHTHTHTHHHDVLVTTHKTFASVFKNKTRTHTTGCFDFYEKKRARNRHGRSRVRFIRKCLNKQNWCVKERAQKEIAQCNKLRNFHFFCCRKKLEKRNLCASKRVQKKQHYVSKFTQLTYDKWAKLLHVW